jgi:hypothetical protein
MYLIQKTNLESLCELGWLRGPTADSPGALARVLYLAPHHAPGRVSPFGSPQLWGSFCGSNVLF